MRELICVVETNDGYYGSMLHGCKVIVRKISNGCVPNGFRVDCEILDRTGIPEDVPKLICFYDDELIPVNCDDLIPTTHSIEQATKNAWIFVNARNDAWNRAEPTDKEAYERNWGYAWKDSRVFDVGCLSY
jgi:hypothetical protein